jgi:hypothetical protein
LGGKDVELCRIGLPVEVAAETVQEAPMRGEDTVAVVAAVETVEDAPGRARLVEDPEAERDRDPEGDKARMLRSTVSQAVFLLEWSQCTFQ